MAADLANDTTDPAVRARLVEYAVLGALHEHGPMTAGQLSRTFRTDVTNTLKALREGGTVIEADGEPGVWRVTTTGERGDDDD